MSSPRPRAPIVIDTDVFSADLVPGSRLAERYAPIITGRPAFISFQTAAEVHYGALRRGWGAARMLGRSVQRHHDTFNESLKNRAEAIAAQAAAGG